MYASVYGRGKGERDIKGTPMTVSIETEGRAIKLVIRRVVPMDVTDGDIERARLQVEREADKAFAKIGQGGIPPAPKKRVQIPGITGPMTSSQG